MILNRIGLYFVRTVCGFAILLIPLSSLMRAILLEDVGRRDDQIYWERIADILLLGQTSAPGLGILFPLLVWFSMGVGLCVLLEKFLKKLMVSGD